MENGKLMLNVVPKILRRYLPPFFFKLSRVTGRGEQNLPFALISASIFEVIRISGRGQKLPPQLEWQKADFS